MDRAVRRVVLDTDIGSDVDDSLALGMLLGSPEVELVGVTTSGSAGQSGSDWRSRSAS